MPKQLNCKSKILTDVLTLSVLSKDLPMTLQILVQPIIIVYWKGYQQKKESSQYLLFWPFHRASK